jgi:glycosyltransferase involved in cell wall biosynthesis
MPLGPRILFTCGREPQYTRNDVLLRALRRRFSLAEVTDRRLGSLTGRIARLVPRLVRALRQPHDLVVVGFYGYPLVWVARRLTDRPILFDAFLLTHDTLVEDRERFRRGSILARLALALDRVGARAADRILVDTAAQAHLVSQTIGLPGDRVRPLFVSCNEDLFYPGVVPDRPADERFHILTYGTYQPLHGMDTVVAAAQLLADQPGMAWRIIGRGQCYPKVQALVERWGLTQVALEPPIPYGELPAAIATADVCLGGPFGTTPKAQRVITGKTFQFMAMAKPVIVSDTQANRELLAPENDAVFVPPGDPGALAAAVDALRRDPARRNRLAAAGRATYLARASEAVIEEQLARLIAELVE